MLKVVGLFRSVCRLIPALFIGLILFPLATLAFQKTIQHENASNTVTQTELANNENSEPAICNLEDDPAALPAPGLPVYDSATLDERIKAGRPTVLPAVKPYYGEKTVYLTFDDGPDPDNTPAILNILRDQGVKATFFVTGSQAEKHPEVLKQTFKNGHALGNHTYSHIYREIYQSVATYSNQLIRTDDIIKKQVGVRPRISRAPGGSAGSFTKEYWETLKTLGYIEAGWNVNSGDASGAKADQIIGNITQQINKNTFLWSHAIILMHDGRGHEETVKALPEIIKLLKNQGFEFRVVNLETPPAW